MKQWFLRIIAFVLLAGGSFLLADGYWIKTKAVLAQFLLQRAWVQTLQNGEQTKPWPWADTWPVARLQVKRLAVDLIVLEGESGEVLAFGPGHLPGSSMPGRSGHCVLAGHRDSSFYFLKDLQAGDIVTLQGRDRTLYEYRIVDTGVREAESLYLQESENPSLTLLTCYPFHALQLQTTLRYLVFCEGMSG
jgi:sortase A